MKNQYAKFVKHLERADAVYFQVVRDNVFLTDGFIAIQVPKDFYNCKILPLSEILPVADEDMTGCKSKMDTIIVKNDKGFDIKSMIYNIKTTCELVKSKFLMEIPGNKKRYARIFFNGETPIFVNDEFVNIFSDVLTVPDVYRSGGGKCDAIIRRDDSYDFIELILPINIANLSYVMPWKGVSK